MIIVFLPKGLIHKNIYKSGRIKESRSIYFKLLSPSLLEENIPVSVFNAEFFICGRMYELPPVEIFGIFIAPVRMHGIGK